LEKVPLAKYVEIRKKFLENMQAAEENNDPVTLNATKTAFGQYMAKILPEFGVSPDELELGPICIDYHRDKKTREFSSDDLFKIMTKSMSYASCRMGARHVPAILKAIEVEGIENGRRLNLCSLNEFRRHFRLKPYKSYAEMLTGTVTPNPDPTLIAALEKHYGKNGIERVEFYPGILIEAIDSDGIGLPLSMGRAILSDAVNLVKNDRFLAYGINAGELTHWGLEYCTKSGDSRSDGPLFKKIIQANFPNWNISELNEKLVDPFHVHSVDKA